MGQRYRARNVPTGGKLTPGWLQYEFYALERSLSVIAGDQIVDSAITTAKLADSAITTTKIADNSISTPKLQANSVTAGKIAAHTITANEIAALTITATEIAATTITAGKLNISQLSAITADMGTLTAGLIRDTNTKFKIDLANVLLTVVDNQGAPVTRVKLGKTGAATTDYGIQVFDQAGNTIVDISGLGVNTVGTTQIVNSAVTSGKISVSQLSAIAADVGTLNAGKIQNAGATAGVLLSGSLPGGWTTYLNLTATGTNPLLHHSALDLNADGTANFSGTVSASSFTATTATFKSITLDGAGGITLSMKDGTGNEVIRATTSTTTGGTIRAWTPNHNNPGYGMYFGGSDINSATGLWSMEWDSNDIYFNVGGSDIVKINGSGSIQLVLAPPTTASAANCFIDTTNLNQLKRSTSSLAFKADVRAVDEASSKDLVLALQPIIFKSLCPGDPKDRDYIGLGAEDVAALDQKYVFVNEKGAPDGVQYDRLIVPLLSFVQQLHRRVLALEPPTLIPSTPGP